MSIGVRICIYVALKNHNNLHAITNVNCPHSFKLREAFLFTQKNRLLSWLVIYQSSIPIDQTARLEQWAYSVDVFQDHADGRKMENNDWTGREGRFIVFICPSTYRCQWTNAGNNTYGTTNFIRYPNQALASDKERGYREWWSSMMKPKLTYILSLTGNRPLTVIPIAAYGPITPCLTFSPTVLHRNGQSITRFYSVR